jgi:transposase-like protein
MKTNSIDPVSAFVRTLDGDYYLVREAAEALGISQHQLRRAIKHEQTGMLPSHGVMIGKMKVYLYTIEDIERMRDIIAQQRAVSDYESIKDKKSGRGGRPAVYTPEERAQRARLYSRACYWKNRIKHAENIKDFEMKRKAEIILAKIEEEIVSGIK